MNSGSIVAGIIGGLISSLIVWAFYHFATDTVLPWYQTRVYRGVLLAGLWTGNRADGGHIFGFSLSLTQRGHIISGTFTANDQRSGGEVTETVFHLTGSIRDSVLLLTYAPSTPERYGSGAFLLRVFNGGKQLQGGMVYFQTHSGKIGAVSDIALERKT